MPVFIGNSKDTVSIVADFISTQTQQELFCALVCEKRKGRRINSMILYYETENIIAKHVLY